MKKSLLIFILLLTVKIYSQRSDQTPQNLPGNTPKAAPYESLVYYKVLKINGIIYMSLGSALIVGGSTLFFSGMSQNISSQNAYQSQLVAYQQSQNSYPYTYQSPPIKPDPIEYLPKIVGGGIMAAAGITFTTIGIIKYIKGKKNERRTKGHFTAFVAPTSFKFIYKF